MKLYKLVRADYTDFWSGKVRYEVGQTVCAPEWNPSKDISCGHGLHASKSIKSAISYVSSEDITRYGIRVLEIDVKKGDYVPSSLNESGGKYNKWRFRECKVTREILSGKIINERHGYTLVFNNSKTDRLVNVHKIASNALIVSGNNTFAEGTTHPDTDSVTICNGASCSLQAHNAIVKLSGANNVRIHNARAVNARGMNAVKTNLLSLAEISSVSINDLTASKVHLYYCGVHIGDSKIEEITISNSSATIDGVLPSETDIIGSSIVAVRSDISKFGNSEHTFRLHNTYSVVVIDGVAYNKVAYKDVAKVCKEMSKDCYEMFIKCIGGNIIKGVTGYSSTLPPGVDGKLAISL